MQECRDRIAAELFKSEASSAAAAAAAPSVPLVAPAAAAAAPSAPTAISSPPAVSSAAAAGPEGDEDMAPLAEPELKRARIIGGLEMRCFEGEPLANPVVLEISELEAAADRSDGGLVPESHFYDARTGEELDLELVRLGRLKELEQTQRRNVYKKIAPGEALGRRVKSKWVDEIRGKQGVEEARSRLAAMEFNTFGREDLSASTPPIVAMRLVVSLAASNGPRRQLAIYDVSVVFFHAEIDELITVIPPRGTSIGWWLLLRVMCGAKQAAQLWQEFLAKTFMQYGWQRSAVAFDAPCTIHGG